MNNCMVTQYIGTVSDNNGFGKLGEFKLHVSPFDSSINRTLRLEVIESITVDFGEGGYDTTNGTNFTNKTLTLQPYVETTVYIDNTKEYDITLDNKYVLRTLYYYYPAVWKLADLAYCEALQKIHGKNGGEVTVDLENDFTHLTKLTEMYFTTTHDWDLDLLPNGFVFGSGSTTKNSRIILFLYSSIDASTKKCFCSLSKAQELFSKYKYANNSLWYKGTVSLSDIYPLHTVFTESENILKFNGENITGSFESLKSSLIEDHGSSGSIKFRFGADTLNVTFDGDSMPKSKDILVSWTSSEVTVSYTGYSKTVNW